MTSSIFESLVRRTRLPWSWFVVLLSLVALDIQLYFWIMKLIVRQAAGKLSGFDSLPVGVGDKTTCFSLYANESVAQE